jgi:hypothetical protein
MFSIDIQKGGHHLVRSEKKEGRGGDKDKASGCRGGRVRGTGTGAGG